MFCGEIMTRTKPLSYRPAVVISDPWLFLTLEYRDGFGSQEGAKFLGDSVSKL